MSIRPLIQISPDAKLKKQSCLGRNCQPVSDFGEPLRELVTDLVETLFHHKIAIGLAAPQIGVMLRVCVVNLKQPDEETLVLVNPQLVANTGKKDKKMESCMSIPHFRGEVERRNKVVISYVSMENAPRTIEASGFLSRVLLHELDHLDGVLYPEKGSGWDDLEPATFF